MTLEELKALVMRADARDPALWRRDAALSAFVDQQLTYVTQRLFEYDLPELKYRLVAPVNTEVPAGAEVYEYHEEEPTGRALVTDDYAEDSPAADVFRTAQTQRIVALRDHYTYSVQDMRKALMGGVDLSERKAVSARDLIERGLDFLTAFGDSDRSIEGMLNHTSVTSADAATVGGSEAWADKTPDQRNADVFTAISAIRSATNGIEGQQVDVLLPESQFMLLESERISDLAMNGLQYLRTAVPAVRSVRPWHYLASANSEGELSDDRMVVYDSNPDKLELILPLPLYTHTPEQRGMTWKTELEARCGGLALYKPKSMYYIDKI